MQELKPPKFRIAVFPGIANLLIGFSFATRESGVPRVKACDFCRKKPEFQKCILPRCFSLLWPLLLTNLLIGKRASHDAMTQKTKKYEDWYHGGVNPKNVKAILHGVSSSAWAGNRRLSGLAVHK